MIAGEKKCHISWMLWFFEPGGTESGSMDEWAYLSLVQWRWRWEASNVGCEVHGFVNVKKGTAETKHG